MTTSPARLLRTYVGSVIAVGGVVLLYAAVCAVSAPQPLAWLMLGALAIFTGWFKLNIAAVSASISVSDTFFITCALLFGPGPATVLVGTSAAVLSARRGHDASRVAFNALAPAVAMFVASELFFRLSGATPLSVLTARPGSLVLPLLVLASTYYALNSGFVAVAVGLESGTSPLRVWRTHLLWLAVGYLASSSIAFCLVLLLKEGSVTAALLVLPLLAVFHLTLRASFGRVEDARRHLADVDRLYHSTVETLAMAIDAKDDVTHSHVRRVQAYAMALAHALSVTDEPTLKALEAAALLHDTGKLAIPEHILNKPGKLTDAEFEKMKLHADIGADILSLVRFSFPVEPIVRCHHENWDGSGYPRGIAGEAIPIGARILSVVDCFDALTSDRPYRRKLPDDAAVAILRERSGTMYDPRVVETFVRIYPGVSIAQDETPEQREVLRRIGATRRDLEPPPLVVPAAMTHDLVAFVSLARVASGDHSVLDVLGLASTLVAGVMPGITGAWFLPDERSDRLQVADAFGPHAARVAGQSVRMGERLTGWVAARRQPIVDADAALDLGVSDDAMPLRRCMSVPVAMGDELAAVLTLYASEAAEFNADYARVVQIVAPHLAATILAARSRERQMPAMSGPDRSAAAGRDLRLVSTR